MNISLRKFTIEDLTVYARWRNAVDANQYMSRFYPRAFNGRDVEGSGLYAWYIIVVDKMDIGTIWLEKDNPLDTTVVLGILIGERDKLGAGVGQQAISLAIAQARPELHFEAVRLNVRKANARAISCYKRCGFAIVSEGSKINQEGEEIAFFEMCLPLRWFVSP